VATSHHRIRQGADRPVPREGSHQRSMGPGARGGQPRAGYGPGARKASRGRAELGPRRAGTRGSTGTCPNGNASGKEVIVTASPASGDAELHPLPLGDPDARGPKYYQVKRQLLELTRAMAPGTPVPPERELAQRYVT